MEKKYLEIRCPKCNKLLCKIEVEKGIAKEVKVRCRNCKKEYTLEKIVGNSNYFLH